MNIPLLILGLAFFAFIPGYLLVRLLFKEQERLEQILLAIVFSIMIAMSIGIFFGYDRAQAARTGGFTLSNIWIGELGISALLGTIHIVKYTIKQHKAATASQKTKKDNENTGNSKHKRNKKKKKNT